jgi:2-methylcitrate dehydratase PrpD
MQAHAEGSSLLALQMGFNARNAVVACDLAAHGFTGPKNVLEGPYGYFRLFEAAGAPQRVAAELGRRWFIVELAYKPFPSGRATHGIVEACLALRREHEIEAAAIDRISVRVPPLVQRLVGRPSRVQMDANYARLSAAYLAARALLTGGVEHEAFTPQAYRHTPTQELAKRVVIDVLDAGANALTPVEVAIDLRSGTRYATRLDVVYGNPAKPIGVAERLVKFRRNCAAALRPPSPEATERRIAQLARLEELEDVAALLAS